MQRSTKPASRGGIINLIRMLAEGSTIDPLPILGASCIIRGIMVGPRDLFVAMNCAIVPHGIRPVIDRVFDFDEAKDALAYLAQGSHLRKVVIRIT